MNSTELPNNSPDPTELFNMFRSLNNDNKIFAQLQSIFSDGSEVNKYMDYLDGMPDLPKKVLMRLKSTLGRYIVYLKQHQKNKSNVVETEVHHEILDIDAQTKNGIYKSIAMMDLIDAKELSPEEKVKLLERLKKNFEESKSFTSFSRTSSASRTERGMDNVTWSMVYERLEASPEKLRILNNMDKTGGKPTLVGHDTETDKFIFVDCYKYLPDVRAHLVYDKKAEEDLQKNARNKIVRICKGNAVDMATKIGSNILTPEDYTRWLKDVVVDGVPGDHTFLKPTDKEREQGIIFYGSQFGPGGGYRDEDTHEWVLGRFQSNIQKGEPSMGCRFRTILNV